MREGWKKMKGDEGGEEEDEGEMSISQGTTQLHWKKQVQHAAYLTCFVELRLCE